MAFYMDLQWSLKLEMRNKNCMKIVKEQKFINVKTCLSFEENWWKGFMEECKIEYRPLLLWINCQKAKIRKSEFYKNQKKTDVYQYKDYPNISNKCWTGD